MPGGWGPWGPNPTMEKWMEKSTITHLEHVVEEKKRGREERQHDHVRPIVRHETVTDGTGTEAWPGEDGGNESTTTPRRRTWSYEIFPRPRSKRARANESKRPSLRDQSVGVPMENRSIGRWRGANHPIAFASSSLVINAMSNLVASLLGRS